MLTKYFLFFVLVIISVNLYANVSFDNVSNLIRVAKYNDAIVTIEKMQDDKMSPIELEKKYYYLGVSQSRLLRFTKSVSNLNKSLSYGNNFNDIYYELGQSYYASNQLEKSRDSFLLSLKKQFKEVISLYYIAHIYQILENYKIAKNYYRLILKHPLSSNEFKQIAGFQLAEVMLSRSEILHDIEIRKGYVKKFILPKYNKFLEMNPDSNIAIDILAKRLQVQNLFGLNPNLLVNGLPLPNKKYNLSLSNKISYDNNMTFATDFPTLKSTSKDSFINLISVGASSTRYFKRKYLFNPFFSFNSTYHSDRQNSDVFSNDSDEIIGGVKAGVEHKLFQSPATFTFSGDYSNIRTDRESKKEISSYSSSFTFSFEESFSLFDFGNTSLNYSMRLSSLYDSALDNKAYTLTVVQSLMRENTDLALIILMYSQNRLNDNKNSSSNTDSYMARIDYIMPEVLPHFILNYSFSILFLDTLEQREDRGIEKMYMPKIILTRKSSKKLQTSLSYEYILNSSLNEDIYGFSKYQIGLEFKYIF